MYIPYVQLTTVWHILRFAKFFVQFETCKDLLSTIVHIFRSAKIFVHIFRLVKIVVQFETWKDCIIYNSAHFQICKDCMTHNKCISSDLQRL